MFNAAAAAAADAAAAAAQAAAVVPADPACIEVMHVSALVDAPAPLSDLTPALPLLSRPSRQRWAVTKPARGTSGS